MNRRKFLAALPSCGILVCAGRFLSGCGGSSSVTQPGQPSQPVPPVPPGRSYDYELCYFPSYGQSLAMGERGVPAISTVQRFDSLMFAGGILAQGYSSDLTADYSSLIPLVEQDSLTNFNSTLMGISDPGETPESGAFEAVKELMQSQDGLGIDDITYRLLGSCPGRGGYNAAQLSQGSVPYDRLLYEVTQAAELAKSMNLSFGVPCINWMQGEDDIHTPAAEYAATLQALFADLGADVQKLTGQTKPVQFLSYQTAAKLGSFRIACAQYELAQQLTNLHIATPAYPFQTDGPPWEDTVHLDNTSYKIMGAYFGSAFKRVVINGETWKPLSPASIATSGAVIVIKLNVYGSAMVVADTVTTTTTCPIKPSLGFTLLDPDGNVVDIDNQVTVTGADELTIACPVTVTSGFVLQYGAYIDGFGGGNIRDNFGDQYVFNGGGLNVPMHNWLTVFQYMFP